MSKLLDHIVWSSIKEIFDTIKRPKKGRPPMSIESSLEMTEDEKEIMKAIWQNSANDRRNK